MTDYTSADQNAVLLTEIAVGVVGMVSTAATAPSGAEAAFAIVSLGVAVFNVRPGSPFYRVGYACEQLAEKLDELENGGGETQGIQALRKKVADAWEGDGADAFDAYVNGKGSGDLLSGIRALGTACKDAAPVYKKVGETLDWGVEAYFVLTIANTIAQLALNYILAQSVGTAAPWIIVAKIAVALLTAAGIFGFIWDIKGSLELDVNTAGDIAVANEHLILAFSEKGDKVESDAVALGKDELESVGNPDDWGKE